MKVFAVPVVVKGQKQRVSFAVGNPDSTHHPLHFQMEYLSKNGGELSPNFADGFSNLHALAVKYKISLDLLCYYATRISEKPNQNKAVAEYEVELNARTLPPIDPTN